MMDKITQLEKGVATAFIDATTPSNLAYKPQFVSNTIRRERRFFPQLKENFCHVRSPLLVLPLLS